MIARIVFAMGAGGAAWVVAGYPLSLALRPSRPIRSGPGQPTITIVVPAYREHDQLPVKLAELAELSYPPELIQLIVAIDGDALLAARAQAAAPDATVILLEERRGKPSALNAALARAHGEIVLLTDAHTPLRREALHHAVRHFADPGVVGVTGRWASHGGAYAAYEERLLRLESRSGSVAGAFGAFFAVRRDRFPTLPETVVNDDLWLLLQLLRGGERVVYEPSAAAGEPPLSTRHELERRQRIGAGRMQLVHELRGLPPAAAWRFANHKLGRLAMPGLLLATLGSSIALHRRPAYRAAALAQLGVLGVGALSAAGIEPRGRARRPARAARELTVVMAATGGGIVRALRAGQDVRWTAVR